MIRLYRQTENGIIRTVDKEAFESNWGSAVWIDLLTPTYEELDRVSKLVKLDMPSRDDMREIEATSRLYTEDGARFMTTTVLSRVDTENPEPAEITFILSDKLIITIRHTDSYSFRVFSLQLLNKHKFVSRDQVFLGLLETIVDRQADVLERFGAELDRISKIIFIDRDELLSSVANNKNTRPRRLQKEETLREVIMDLGRTGDLISQHRECLVNLSRLISYAGQEDIDTGSPSGLYARLRPISRDISSLTEYASFLSGKVNFMLDATLGLINIEQNQIVKIFTVAAVIFMPPTLIASIYGMNFQHMPELSHELGYPFALGVMIVSVIVPLTFFRKKRWI